MPNNKIRICLVGGEDAYKRIDFSDHLVKAHFDVTIMGSEYFNFPDWIHFIKYDLNRSLSLFDDLNTLRQYHRIFKRESFDIIQTFDTKPAFLVPIATFFGRKKLVIRTITGLGTVFMANELKFKILRKFYIILHRIAKKRVYHTVFQNTQDQSLFLQNKLVDNHNSSIIFGSGIDLKKIKNKAVRHNKVFSFICVARLVYEKGIHNYLEAARLCNDQGHKFKFLLVGPLEGHSKKLNEEVLDNYKTYVEWLGCRSDVNSLLLQSDAFVLPTFREGFSRVLLEASAIGLPSITTNVPGCKEIIGHLKEGLLVDVNDSEQLSKAMIMLALDENLADSFACNAFEKVKQFGLDVISRQYIDLYKNAYENTFFTPVY